MPTLNSFSANTKAESAKVNQNFTNINNVLRPTFELGVNGTLSVVTNATSVSLIITQAMTITKAYAVLVGDSPSGADIIIDINVNGTTIWSNQTNRLTITDGTSSASTSTFNTTELTEGDYITLDIDQVGSTTEGSNLTVALKCSL